MRTNVRLFVFIAMILFLLFPLWGCNDSGGGSGSGDSGSISTATLDGTLSKGPTTGASVTVFTVENGKKGDPVGEGTTDENGQYEIDLELDGYDGPLYIEATGGKYIDEATEEETDLEGTLRAAIPEVASDRITGCVTPLTELAVRKAGAALDANTIRASNEMISQMLGDEGDILSARPFDPTKENAGDAATETEKTYTMLLAALSQMAQTQDIEQVLKDLEEDLEDNMLDQSGQQLQDAIDAFAANEHNKAGVDDSAGTIKERIQTIAENGMEPTGDLADLKKALIDFLRAPSKKNFTAFNALYPLTPESPEGHLYAALGELTAIYESDAAAFFKDELGIDFGTDFDANAEAIENALLDMNNYDQEILDTIAEINDRLSGVKGHLEKAEGANIAISLTGFDTVYLDDVDIKLLKAMTNVLIAGCSYIEAVDFSVSQWEVNGTDFRQIEEPTDAQTAAFFDNNPNFLTYADTGKLADFKTALNNARSAYDSAYTALDAMSEEELNQRAQNAFTPLYGEFGLKMAQALNEETMTSISDALRDHTAGITVPNAEETDGTVIVGEDGFAYWQSTFDIYLGTLKPNLELSGQDFTLYHFAEGDTSVRDLIDFEFSNQEGTELYVLDEQSAEEYATGLKETHFDDPIDTHAIDATENITIDGSADDWSGIAPLIQNDNLTVKLAQNAAGKLFVFFQAEGMNEVHIDLSSWNKNTQGGEPVFVGLSGSGDWYAQYADSNPDYESLDSTTGMEAAFPAEALDELTRKGDINSYYYNIFNQDNEYIDDWKEVKFLTESVQ